MKMNATRAYALEQFSEILGLPQDNPSVVNLEKSILNHTYDSMKSADECSFENQWFLNVYRLKFLSIRKNLLESSHLKNDVLEKKLKASEVVELKPWELWKDGPYATAMETKIRKDMKKEFNAKEAKEQMEGFFQCRRCKSKKTTYYEMQTRSADEPMTVFVSCHNCTASWKC
jgi:DNA-directed RNA polymerase subunit M/transcription elongation factor TFIIS